jgi:hypothetical protein
MVAEHNLAGNLLLDGVPRILHVFTPVRVNIEACEVPCQYVEVVKHWRSCSLWQVAGPVLLIYWVCFLNVPPNLQELPLTCLRWHVHIGFAGDAANGVRLHICPQPPRLQNLQTYGVGQSVLSPLSFLFSLMSWPSCRSRTFRLRKDGHCTASCPSASGLSLCVIR